MGGLVEIRDATFNDLEAILPIMHAEHERTIFRDMPMNDAIIQRNFVTAMAMDNGFAKVIEHKGKVVGCLVGIIAENHFGLRCAQDLFNGSSRGTDMLVRSFLLWSNARSVQFVQLTEYTGKERYRDLLTGLGLQPCGMNFVGVI